MSALVRRVVASLVIASVVSVARAHDDPVLGTWVGTAGKPDDRSVFALEVTRGAKDALRARVWLVELHMFGVDVPEIVARGDGKYAIPAFGLELVLANDRPDRLSGPFGAGGAGTVELARGGTLPVDVSIPTDLPRGPDPLWETQLAASIWARAELRGGVAYVGTDGGVFHAVNVKDGTIAWTFAAGRPILGEALATDDAVVFACDDGWLRSLDRSSGKERWRYDLGDARVARIMPHPSVDGFEHMAPKPVLADGVLYVGSGDGGFHAIDARTGERAWRVDVAGKVRASAVLDGERVVLGTMDEGGGGRVRALDRASGSEVWSRDVKGAVTSAPALLGDAIVIGTRGSLLAAVERATGATRWRQGWWGSWVESTPVAAGELAIVGSSDARRVTCFDPKNGDVAWRADVFGWSWGSPVVTKDAVYVATGAVAPYLIRHAAALVALERASGKLRWYRPVARPEGRYHWGYAAGFALDGETLVIGGLDGMLRAFPAK